MKSIKDVEQKLIEHFTEEFNLFEYFELSKKCAKRFVAQQFEKILSGDFEMPPSGNIKAIIKEHVPVDFDAENFVKSGPLDFSSIDNINLDDVVARAQSIHENIQAGKIQAVAKATLNYIEKMVDEMKGEIDSIRSKYLTDDE